VEIDVVGIGFGPANIAFAIAMEEFGIPARPYFVERQSQPGWQPGMLLDQSDIQHHPARDLALPRNPRSHYTFFNYLFEEGRLFEFLNLGLPLPLRKDYARYVTWAANHFTDQVRFGVAAVSVTAVPGEAGSPAVEVGLDDGSVVRARVVVLAPGRPPHIPDVFQGITDRRVYHFTEYLNRLPELVAARQPRLAIIGGSQSAVELVLDASRQLPHGVIINILRGFGYRQKDLSPFNCEVYYPQFINYYYEASEDSKRNLDQQLRYTNYSSADIDVIQALYTQLYEQRLDGVDRVRLLRNTDVIGCDPRPGGVRLTVREVHRRTVEEIDVDAVVLATGFVDLTDESGAFFLPPMLDPIASAVARAPSGRAVIDRDYRLAFASGATLPSIYLNGLCETTHGMGDAGSFSLLSLRAATIAESVHKALTCPAYRLAASGTGVHGGVPS